MNLKDHQTEKDIEIKTLPDNKLQIFLPPSIIGPLENYIMPRTPNLCININNIHEPDRTNFTFASKLEYLGSGGFSKVYRYRGDLNNKAVKKIVADPKYYSKKLTAEDSIKREIYGMAKVNCPNSLKVYGVYQNEAKDNFYILMELCDGNIENYIKTRGFPLNIYEIIILLFQLNKAFYLLDRNNIIHRDIKPSNILYREDKDIDPHNKRINKKLFGGKKLTFKLGDYGVCIPLYDQKFSKSQFMGTLDFMAPEIYEMKCEKEHPVFTKKIDLFSLGQSILCLMGFIEKASTLTSTMVEDLRKSCNLFNGNRKEKLLADLVFNYLLVFDVEKRADWKVYFKHPIFEDDLLYNKYENKIMINKGENSIRIEKRLIKRNSMDSTNKEMNNKNKINKFTTENNENKNNNDSNMNKNINTISKCNSNINKSNNININTNPNKSINKSNIIINKCNSHINKSININLNTNKSINNINKCYSIVNKTNTNNINRNKNNIINMNKRINLNKSINVNNSINLKKSTNNLNKSINSLNKSIHRLNKNNIMNKSDKNINKRKYNMNKSDKNMSKINNKIKLSNENNNKVNKENTQKLIEKKNIKENNLLSEKNKKSNIIIKDINKYNGKDNYNDNNKANKDNNSFYYKQNNKDNSKVNANYKEKDKIDDKEKSFMYKKIKNIKVFNSNNEEIDVRNQKNNILNKDKIYNISVPFDIHNYKIEKKLTYFNPRIKPLISSKEEKTEENIIKNYKTKFFINNRFQDMNKIKNIYINNDNNNRRTNNNSNSINFANKSILFTNVLNKNSERNIFNVNKNQNNDIKRQNNDIKNYKYESNNQNNRNKNKINVNRIQNNENKKSEKYEKNKFSRVIIINDNLFPSYFMKNKNKSNFSISNNYMNDKIGTSHGSFFSVRNKYKRLNHKDISINDKELDFNNKKKFKAKNNNCNISQNLSPKSLNLYDDDTKCTYQHRKSSINKLKMYANNSPREVTRNKNKYNLKNCNNSPNYRTSKSQLKYNTKFNASYIATTEINLRNQNFERNPLKNKSFKFNNHNEHDDYYYNFDDNNNSNYPRRKKHFFNIRVVSEKIQDNYKKKIDRNNAFYFSRHTRINNYE